MTRSPLATVALAVAVVLVVAPAGAAMRDRAGEDSPWPRTGELRANVRAVNTVVRQLEADVELMEQSADRYADWQSCLRAVPVSEYGDQDGRSGYLYDERDGTGLGHMSALAVDRNSRPRREDYLFLDFAGSAACRSHAPRPGGTADAAAARSAAPRRARPPTLTGLERRVEALKRSTRRLDAASERFDEWESCVSWVPVTEYGDPDGGFGYLFLKRDQSAAYRPALAVDRSDWDDPDYMILAFVSGDRPGRGCQDEPGEAVD